MANKDTRLWRSMMHNQNGIVQLAGKVVLDSNGEQSTLTFPGVTSVTEDATGKYTFLLDDEWGEFIGASIICQKATQIHLIPQVQSETVAATTKTIVVWFTDADKAHASPDSCTVHCIFWLRSPAVSVIT